MATNADANRLGFITPAGTDLIRDGDDAISQNARALTELFGEYRMNRGKIPPDSDIRTFTTPQHSGLWHVDSQSAAETIAGTPAGLPSNLQFELFIMMGATGVMWLFPYGYYGLPFAYVCKVLNVSGSKTLSEWTPWEPTTSDDLGDGTEGAWGAHLAQQARFLAAMGGPIDTGGRAAVALRFDHGLANFKTKVLPLTKARGLKVSQAYNPRNWGYAENAGVTATELNSWVAAGDVEVWNHSASHAGADTPEALHEQIVTGLAEIEAELPAARGQVWGWNPPGVSTGNYGGYDGGKTPAGWNTTAGRLILAHHAVASGSLAGTQLQTLDGQPRPGLARYQMDTESVAAIKAQIDAAIAGRKGLQLMLHPSLLDTPGSLTTAQLNEVLDYLTAKRTAGELVTLSPYQLTIADSTRPQFSAPSWSDVTGKPETFAPSPHTHAIADVTGLADRLAALEYDSGLRSLDALAATDQGWAATPIIRAMRQGPVTTVSVRSLKRDEAGDGYHIVATLPPSMRPVVERFGQTFRGYRFTITTGGDIRISSPGTVYDYLSDTFGVRAPAPFTPPGDPA